MARKKQTKSDGRVARGKAARGKRAGAKAAATKAAGDKSASEPGEAYQFTITLKEAEPPIWRRILVADCTLHEFHDHIQAAMGWTNSHLHQFEIDGECYGNPEQLEDIDCIDSTETRISQIVPAGRKRLRFSYEYDFGDGWDHEIAFEGRVKPERGKKLPLCVEGARACPPEDVGGVWGYMDFLDAINDPDADEHDGMLEWCGPFDPEAFDAAKATKAMRTAEPGLLDDMW